MTPVRIIKGLARRLSGSSVRFQPLPIRTAREVFPQAAHPVGFIGRFMRRVEHVTATFAQGSLPPARDERLRKRYRPRVLRLLFIGESRPAGGTFFYAADSNLFFHTQSAFGGAYGDRLPQGVQFLDFFKSAGCYLEDLCLEPVNRLPPTPRRVAHHAATGPLAERIGSRRPGTIVVVGLGRSLRSCIGKALKLANLEDVPRFELPFPAMSHQPRYLSELSALIEELRAKGILP